MANKPINIPKFTVLEVAVKIKIVTSDLSSLLSDYENHCLLGCDTA
jgi:hypothetical protein